MVNSKIVFHNLDLTNTEAVNRFFDVYNPDYVFHLAAQSYPQTSFDSPIETLQTNILGTTNLLSTIYF